MYNKLGIVAAINYLDSHYEKVSGRKKGCVYCTAMHLRRCPDAFTEVAPHCGNYDNSEMPQMSGMQKSQSKVVKSIYYSNVDSFYEQLKESNYYGQPMTVTLFADKDGNTIDKTILLKADPPVPYFITGENDTARWKGAGLGEYECSYCGELVSGNSLEYCPNCKRRMWLNGERTGS